MFKVGDTIQGIHSDVSGSRQWILTDYFPNEHYCFQSVEVGNEGFGSYWSEDYLKANMFVVNTYALPYSHRS